MDSSRKKLLVLDVNGLLVDTYFHKEPHPKESPDAKVGNFYVYKRPFCEEFLQFCLENFLVGIWSSARQHNVNNMVDYVFGESKGKLAFSWHQLDCTNSGLRAPENKYKPLFLKELSKLWESSKPKVPWEEGAYGPSNTLLVDDTPYKAFRNPPNTAIFPRPYTAHDAGDNILGCALREYLEGLREAADVQMYVKNNPFGEPSITPESPQWSYLSQLLVTVKSVAGDKVSTQVGNGLDSALADLSVDIIQVEETNGTLQVTNGKHLSSNISLQTIQDGTKSSDVNGTSESPMAISDIARLDLLVGDVDKFDENVLASVGHEKQISEEDPGCYGSSRHRISDIGRLDLLVGDEDKIDENVLANVGHEKQISEEDPGCYGSNRHRVSRNSTPIGHEPNDNLASVYGEQRAWKSSMKKRNKAFRVLRHPDKFKDQQMSFKGKRKTFDNREYVFPHRGGSHRLENLEEKHEWDHGTRKLFKGEDIHRGVDLREIHEGDYETRKPIKVDDVRSGGMFPKKGTGRHFSSCPRQLSSDNQLVSMVEPYASASHRFSHGRYFGSSNHKSDDGWDSHLRQLSSDDHLVSMVGPCPTGSHRSSSGNRGRHLGSSNYKSDHGWDIPNTFIEPSIWGKDDEQTTQRDYTGKVHTRSRDLLFFNKDDKLTVENYSRRSQRSFSGGRGRCIGGEDHRSDDGLDFPNRGSIEQPSSFHKDDEQFVRVGNSHIRSRAMPFFREDDNVMGHSSLVPKAFHSKSRSGSRDVENGSNWSKLEEPNNRPGNRIMKRAYAREREMPYRPGSRDRGVHHGMQSGGTAQHHMSQSRDRIASHDQIDMLVGANKFEKSGNNHVHQRNFGYSSNERETAVLDTRWMDFPHGRRDTWAGQGGGQNSVADPRMEFRSQSLRSYSDYNQGYVQHRRAH